MIKDELFKKAEELLDRCDIVQAASVNEDGFPRICVLIKLKSEGFHTVYFSTGTHSKKTKHFRQNSKAGLSYYDQNDSVTLVGNAEIIEDDDIKKSLWQDFMIKHFPGGTEDEEYCVIKFKAKEATIYIDDVLKTYKL
ncbi:MAG: pyridoxamine 5'-phosphate oxidase family protein [Oscillospiraceae bacterium]|jgi:general stress protein 26|nr:pyridoxamine 5'-phosphate oxidase family protein [Oscillospiraceae bacterium]